MTPALFPYPAASFHPRSVIISHRYRFIFIKCEKTAGTSTEIFLSPHCGEDDVLTPIYPPMAPHRPRHWRGLWNPLPDLAEQGLRNAGNLARNWLRGRKFTNHQAARIVRRRVPRQVWDGYFKFCVERNPWDKTLSHYHMLRDRTGGLSLDEYFRRGKFCINYPKYLDTDGKLLVDRVVRYENLLGELGEIFTRLGVPFEGTLGVNAKSEHRKDRAPYQEVLTPEQAGMVGKVFAREIALHGYRF